jgi:signal transduction histidine kinase/ActR/RegA family two-component response regulator
MKALTLRTQLARAALATTLAALLLNAVLVLAYEFDRYRDARWRDLHTQAEILKQSIAPALVFDDPESARQQLSPLSQKRDVKAAAVFRADGTLFARYAADPLDRTAMATNPLPQPGVRFSGGTLELTEDILHDGELVGRVYLQASYDMARRLESYALIEVVVITLSMALAIFLFGRLQKSITGPVARIAEVAQEVVQRREWGLRAPTSGSRDIGALVDAFNRMLQEMETTTLELNREMAERERAEDELRRADRRKDEFLATLAHEIRNPLAPMMNAVSLLRRGDMPEAMRSKSIAILDRQLRHVVRLIDDLLDVSRISTGKLSLHKEDVDLVAVLRSALELIEPAARERQLAVAARQDEPPCVIEADPARLLQVFSNLLGNACRYTPPGGRVTVTVERHAGRVDVLVDDTGVGIAAAMQERIFELFEQGDKSLERGNTGLGIGLTLARQLVLLHGGTLRVQSEGLGRGSRFIVCLPLPAQARPAANPAAPPAQPRGQRLRVLLADDNVDYANSMQTLLEAAGLTVTSVHDGLAAVAAAQADVPDVAILDIGMPGLNGYEVARRLRAGAATAGVALIAVSGWGQESDKRDALEAGFDRHLVKPVGVQALLEALATLRPGSSGPVPSEDSSEDPPA